MRTVESTYVYGVVGDAELPPLKGIDERPTRTTGTGGISAVVSSVREVPIPATRANLSAHNDVVGDVARATTILPMGFGVVVASDEAVVNDVLAPRRKYLLEQLDYFADYVELDLKVYYREEVFLGEVVREDRAIARLRDETRRLAGDAGYYDRIRLGELTFAAVTRKRQREAGEIRSALERLAASIHLSDDPVPERVLLKAAFLVDRDRVVEFEHAVETLARRDPGRLQFKLVGPLPPYSFVTLTASEGVTV